MATTIQQIEEALRNSGGFLTTAAEQLGVSHQAVSERIKKSEYLQQVRDEIQESYLDLAETQLISKVKEGDNGSIFFYLKCKGKGRGYVEKQIVDQTLNGNVEVGWRE